MASDSFKSVIIINLFNVGTPWFTYGFLFVIKEYIVTINSLLSFKKTRGTNSYQAVP